ncbi:hypothetical protein LCGC14_1763090 [marine sediment metagenome]|uniref:Uncharacterized protein n=1 Tax=marine sediment metagenome TaxID=412755 RepID=A0A0F9HMU8_9ZZZZ
MVKVFQGEKSEYYMDGILESNLQSAKDAIKKDWDMIFLVDGYEGCLSGETEIQISRNKVSKRYNIKWLYNQFNNDPDKIVPKTKNWDLSKLSYVRAFNGSDIRLHKIHNVIYSGTKVVYRLTLDNGKSIKATEGHKFLTRTGWKELKDLVINQDELMHDSLHPKKTKRKRIKLYDIMLGVDYHPNTKCGRVEVHKLIYEAYINKLHFTEYLDILLNEPEKAKRLKFIDPTKFHVHHKDGCHYNNSIDNLKLIKKEEHWLYHGKNIYAHFSQGVPLFSKVKNISFVGPEDTYDIQCEEPHHNFVANGIIAHNSGKSVFAMQCAYFCDPTLNLNRVAFTSKEFTDVITKAKKHEAVVYDEAYTGLSSRATMSVINRALVSMLAEIRQKNLFVFIVMPTFFDLDKYVALWRSRALFHVYVTKGFQRGYFRFYSMERKKILFVLGKKYYNYSKPKDNFHGRFTNNYVLDEVKYRAKKRKSLLYRAKKREEAEVKRAIEDGLFERAVSLKGKIPNGLIMEMLGMPAGTFYGKLKRLEQENEIA